MNEVDTLLARLDGVRQTGGSKWIAKCPAHDDRKPSLSITETTEGVLLINCFAGCTAAEIVSAVGLDLGDLFPPKESAGWEARNDRPKRTRSTFSAHSVLRLIAADALDVAILASDIAKGLPVTDDVRERLWDAAGRISTGLEETNAAR